MTTLRDRARALGLHGLIDRWEDVANADWLEELIASEEQVRRIRSYERRRAEARLPAFSKRVNCDVR